jgi:hypothetical protein
MAEFSLGAAIGATGRFPKLKIAAEDDKADDRTAKELAAIKSGIALDDDQYHNVYVESVTNTTKDAIKTILDLEKNKSPDLVRNAYEINQNLKASRNYAKNQGEYLKNMEKLIETADLTGKYLPTDLKDKLLYRIKYSKSETELFNYLRENPKLFRDGYVEFDGNKTGLMGLQVLPHDKIDFTKLINNTKLFDPQKHYVKISENKTVTDKERTIDRFLTVPKDRAEAEQLARTDKTVVVSNNAYELGKTWFTENPTAVKQYRSMLYEKNDLKDGDPAETDNNALYERFYKDHIIPSIPKKYENKDAVLPRYLTNININTAPAVAPTNFSLGALTTNYQGDQELYSENTVAASLDPEGVDVEIPQNRFAINLNTGVSEFTGTAMKTVKASTIGVFPAIPVLDKATGKKVLYPLSKVQQKQADDNGTPYMMYPFALVTAKPLNVGELTDISKTTYAVPLYDPDPNGNFVIPSQVRNAKTIRNSPLLDKIIQRNKWDEKTLTNWTQSYLGAMKTVKDENDYNNLKKK